MNPAERALVDSLCEKLYTVSQHLSRLAEREDRRNVTVGMRLNPDLERRCLELAGLVPGSDLSEKEFQAIVLTLARREGWRTYHTHDSRKSAAGFPDIVAVHPTRGLWFAELKSADGRATDDQSRWLVDLMLVTNPPVVGLYRPADWPEIERILKGKT